MRSKTISKQKQTTYTKLITSKMCCVHFLVIYINIFINIIIDRSVAMNIV